MDGFEQVGAGDAQGDFVAGKIAEAEEEVVDSVGGSRALIFAEELEVGFDFSDGDGVEELAEVGFAEEVGEQRLIDGEGGGAAFGEGRIAVVDEVAGVSEEQRRREGRGLVGVDDVDLDFLFLDGAEDIDEGGHVEGVAQAFAMGFEEHGEARDSGRRRRGGRRRVCAAARAGRGFGGGGGGGAGRGRRLRGILRRRARWS